jgi:hypothetical protein
MSSKTCYLNVKVKKVIVKAEMSTNGDFDTSSDDEVDENEDEEKQYSNSTDSDDVADEENEEIVRSVIYINSDNEEFTSEQIDAIPSLSASLFVNVNDSNDDSSEPLEYADNMIQDMLRSVFERSISSTNEPHNLMQEFEQLTDPYFRLAELSQQYIPQTSSTIVQNHQFVFTGTFSTILASTASGSFNSANSTHPISEPSMFVLSQPLFSSSEEPSTPIRRLRNHPIFAAPMRARARRRYFTREAPSVILSRHTTSFSSEDYELALTYFNHIIHEDEADFIVDYNANVCVNVLNLLLEYWMEHERESFPDYEYVVNQVCRELMRSFHIDFEQEDLFDIVDHYLHIWGFLPAPMELQHVYEFFTFNGEYPTYTQLQEMNQRALAFFTNPELYHQQDKIHVPALHIDKIERVKNTEQNVVCCICQEEIQLEQTIIRLPPCNHTYHVEANECLGDGSILTWLAENNTCPMCKRKVEVA